MSFQTDLNSDSAVFNNAAEFGVDCTYMVKSTGISSSIVAVFSFQSDLATVAYGMAETAIVAVPYTVGAPAIYDTLTHPTRGLYTVKSIIGGNPEIGWDLLVEADQRQKVAVA